MRAAAIGIAVAAMGVLGAASAAGTGDEVQVTRAVLRTRVEPVAVLLDSQSGSDPWTWTSADVEIRGVLPPGFRIEADSEDATVSVELHLNGQDVDAETLAPGRRRGVWDPVVIQGPYVWVTYARWYRARIDLRRGTFWFRTRGVEHVVMEGDPGGVPLVLRIGDRTLGGTVDFSASNPDLWTFVAPPVPLRIPFDVR